MYPGSRAIPWQWAVQLCSAALTNFPGQVPEAIISGEWTTRSLLAGAPSVSRPAASERRILARLRDLGGKAERALLFSHKARRQEREREQRKRTIRWRERAGIYGGRSSRRCRRRRLCKGRKPGRGRGRGEACSLRRSGSLGIAYEPELCVILSRAEQTVLAKRKMTRGALVAPKVIALVSRGRVWCRSRINSWSGRGRRCEDQVCSVREQIASSA